MVDYETSVLLKICKNTEPVISAQDKIYTVYICLKSLTCKLTNLTKLSVRQNPQKICNSKDRLPNHWFYLLIIITSLYFIIKYSLYLMNILPLITSINILHLHLHSDNIPLPYYSLYLITPSVFISIPYQRNYDNPAKATTNLQNPSPQ